MCLQQAVTNFARIVLEDSLHCVICLTPEKIVTCIVGTSVLYIRLGKSSYFLSSETGKCFLDRDIAIYILHREEG